MGARARFCWWEGQPTISRVTGGGLRLSAGSCCSQIFVVSKAGGLRTHTVLSLNFSAAFLAASRSPKLNGTEPSMYCFGSLEPITHWNRVAVIVSLREMKVYSITFGSCMVTHQTACYAVPPFMFLRVSYLMLFVIARLAELGQRGQSGARDGE